MKYVALIVSMVILAGCSEDQGARTRISNLEKRLASTEAQAKQLAETLANVQWEMFSKLESQSAAVVDPSNKGYSIARNEYGAFPVIIDDAQPYLDGHKVKFRVGNVTSATMTGVKLKIVYGVRDPAFPTRNEKLSAVERVKALLQYSETVEENKKTRRTLTVAAGTDFAAASWNIVDVIISPSKPEDLGRVEVSVEVTGMTLSTPR